MIKATFESLQPINGNSFLTRRFNEKAFSAPYHFHPEYELTYIVKGEGKRFVGNDMAPYRAGDLVLIGSNLQHCWKSENIGRTKLNASSLVTQFTYGFLGADFFASTEMDSIRLLLERSRYGIHFLHKTTNAVKESLALLFDEENPFKKLLHFLDILHQLSISKNYQLLDKKQQPFTEAPNEQKRINDVLAYIVENFRDEIILEEAATIACMTSTAFCKYFKRMTRKTFIETVMDYRINYATQQLVNTDKPISDIAFESGFGDISHFHKKFKLKKNISPLTYRKNFAKEIS
ncbi:AraC family transcriptional regulator [soil metagenome]